MLMHIWHRFIHPISSYFRGKRAETLLRYYPNFADLRICDLGGSRHFWEESNLDVNPGNINIVNISSDTTDTYANTAFQHISVILYDGKYIPVADKYYDLLICNSVLEHVSRGDRENLCNEMRRVARHIYLQTPAYEFPVEPHFIVPFLHWLPRTMGRFLARLSPWAILSRPSQATFTRYFDEIQLLARKEIISLFPDANLRIERFVGLRKSYLVFSETK